MTDETETAERYRIRAEELRAIAADSPRSVNRASLLRIAEDYDRMAETLLTIDRTNAAIHRPRSNT